MTSCLKLYTLSLKKQSRLHLCNIQNKSLSKKSSVKFFGINTRDFSVPVCQYFYKLFLCNRCSRFWLIDVFNKKILHFELVLYYSLLLQCCANVSRIGPALKQRWTNGGFQYFTFEYTWSIVKLWRTRDVAPVLVERRTDIVDVGPSLCQGPVDKVCSLEHHHCTLICLNILTPRFYTSFSCILII